MSSQFGQSESTFQNTEFKWSHSANWLLINSYLELKDEFRDPRIKKKELWIRISDKFREFGYEITFDVLDKKFRNLKSTYYQVKERKQQSSHKSIKWEYYKVFDELLKDDEIAAANVATANPSATHNDPRLTNFRSSVGLPAESRKRRRSNSKGNNGTIKMVTIEPAGDVDDFENDSIAAGSSEFARGDNNVEYDVNYTIMEDSQDGTFVDEDDGQGSNVNTNRESIGKKYNLGNLEARKLHAETRYFNTKADYFEKQTMCLDIQRKLMIMQAHKLKLEIDRMRSDTK